MISTTLEGTGVFLEGTDFFCVAVSGTLEGLEGVEGKKPLACAHAHACAHACDPRPSSPLSPLMSLILLRSTL